MNGNDLIKMGFKPRDWFPEMLRLGNVLEENEISQEQILEALQEVYDERQIKDYKLAKVIDKVLPLGSMMAGNYEQPWRKYK